MASTKEFAALWRPQLHCVAVLAAGVCECYFLLTPEQASDSNMQMSLLSHALDIVHDVLTTRRRAMPLHLVVQADNTAREQRKQYLFQWAGSVVLKGLFQSISYTFLTVGHTHNLVDQRFSIIRSALCQEASLESPEDRAPQPHASHSSVCVCVRICVHCAGASRVWQWLRKAPCGACVCAVGLPDSSFCCLFGPPFLP